jgi:hypothetical protein
MAVSPFLTRRVDPGIMHQGLRRFCTLMVFLTGLGPQVCEPAYDLRENRI